MRTTADIQLRPIIAADNLHIARVIRDVSAEFGLTADKGYTVADPNLDQLFELYSAEHSAYWVVEHQGKVMGGGGIAPPPAARRISVNCKRCISCPLSAASAWRANWRC